MTASKNQNQAKLDALMAAALHRASHAPPRAVKLIPLRHRAVG
jgi:hypothetical protein